MSEFGPLQHPDLLAVENLLDERKLDEAQRRLATLGQRQGVDHALAYLTTRLLYLRGRLDVRGVADRLRELLRVSQEFPQARYMLDAAETGVLTRTVAPPEKSPVALAAPNVAPAAPNVAPAAAVVAPAPLSGPALRVRSNLGGVAPSLEVPRAPSWPAPALLGESAPVGSWAPPEAPAPPPAAEAPLADLARGLPPLFSSATLAYESPAEVLAPTAGGPPATPRLGPRASDRGDDRPEGSERPTAEQPGPRVRFSPEPPREHPASDAKLPETEPPDDPLSLAELASAGARDDFGQHITAPPHISTEPGVAPSQHAPGQVTDSTFEHVRQLVSPAIPRAPAIPRIEAPPDITPSYAPAAHAAGAPLRPSERPEPSTVRGTSETLATRYSAAPGHEEFVFSRAPSQRPGRRPAAGAHAQGPSTQGVRRAETRRRGSSHPPGVIHAEPAAQRHRTPTAGSPVPDAVAPPRPRGAVEVGGPTTELTDASDETVYRIRSDFPPPVGENQPMRPSLFEVATLLDAARYEEALSLLGTSAPASDPESSLLRARALDGAGRRGEARATLASLAATPDLDVDFRAGVARLLIELGDTANALAEARRAAAIDLERPLVRLTLAWAAIRAARATGDQALVAEADQILDGLKTRGGPHPGLVQALRACVQANIGDAERAIALAQRALGLDATSPDALAAVAVASTRLDRVHDAQQAWLRLHDCAPREANALKASLEAARIQLPEPGAVPRRGFADDAEARALWHPAELAVIDGDRRYAQQAFEHACRRRLAQVVESGSDESFPAMAAVAVHALTEDPVWAHFAPFDLSLWSIHRLRAGLDLVYDPAFRLDDDMDDFPVTLLLGAYVGQVLCQTFGGRWEGTIAELGTSAVVSAERRFSPFATVAARLRAGRPLELGSALDLKHAHPGADAWSEQVAPSVVPPCPWSPVTWPRPSTLTRLGRALSCSVVSEWCRRHSAGPLDGSMASLASIEAYLALVAPPAARPRVSDPWLPRVSVLVGAYLGEVLRETIGGAWEPDHGDVGDPGDYRLKLGHRTVTPLLEVHQVLLGRAALPLHDYAARLAR